ncbi:MAG: type II toxin-antitoxin system HicA family toxin [Bacteroidota bacterium]|nr:type II toxin-antitoxin system HicA family toxin [Bacteroidota bacterium]
MTKLPVLHGKHVISALRKIGYSVVRQKGSHLRLECSGKTSVTVPHHNIGRGLLRKILRDAELTPEEFQKLL